MSLQFLCLSLCVLSVFGNSLSGDVRQTATTQTVNKLVEESVGNHLKVLETRFETLEKENSFLKSELASLQLDIAARNHGDGYHGDVGDGTDATMVANRPRRLSRDTRNYRVASPNVQPQVAFQAVLDHNIGNLGDDETIKFTRVDLNVGNGYNGNTGMFICAVPGLYVFHINIVNFPGKSVELHFLKNGSVFGIVYLGDDGGSLSESASSTAVVQLAASDKVWMATNPNHNTGEVILPRYSYISGYLLSPNTA